MGDLEALAERLGGAQRVGRDLRAFCPAHLDTRPSLSIARGKVHSVVVHCRAGCAQRDVITAMRNMGCWPWPPRGGSYASLRPPAASRPKKLESVDEDEWQVVMPVPVDSPPLPSMRRGNQRWFYRDAAGHLLGAVERMNNSRGEKLGIFPWTYCRHLRSGRLEWRKQWFPSPRPLFGLDRLTANPELSVVIVEGEKKTQLANGVCPQFVWVAWPCGADAALFADWSYLADRTAIVWPDADPTGIRAAADYRPSNQFHRQVGSHFTATPQCAESLGRC